MDTQRILGSDHSMVLLAGLPLPEGFSRFESIVTSHNGSARMNVLYMATRPRHAGRT